MGHRPRSSCGERTVEPSASVQRSRVCVCACERVAPEEGSGQEGLGTVRQEALFLPLLLFAL